MGSYLFPHNTCVVFHNSIGVWDNLAFWLGEPSDYKVVNYNDSTFSNYLFAWCWYADTKNDYYRKTKAQHN